MSKIRIIVFLVALSGLISSFSTSGFAMSSSELTAFNQDTLVRCAINFRHDHAAIDSSYLNNSQALAEIRKALETVETEHPGGGIASIIIEGSSSPVGYEPYNQRLSRLRAKKVEAFLRTLPALQDVDMKVIGKGEDWQTFTRDIKADYTRKNRKKLLSILDSDLSPTLKKQKIAALDSDGTTWHYLVRNFMTNSRQAVTIVVVKKSRVVQSALPRLYAPKDSLKVSSQSLAQPQLQPVEQEPSQPQLEPQQSELSQPQSAKADDQPQPQTPRFSLRTNLLVPALNVGAELPIGNNWSVAADYYYPWIWPGQKNKNCFEFLGWSAEGRYWFGRERMPQDRLKGHSVGLYVAGGYFDFEKNFRGMQGEFVSPGVDYTYSMAIGRKKNLHLQFTLAVGYIRSWGRTYDVYGEYGELYPDEGTLVWDYVGPTKAAVTLVVPFYKKEGRK